MMKVKLLASLAATSLMATSTYGQMNSDEFFIGSNDAGQTATTFMAAEACDVTTPTATGDLGPFENMHAIIIANGTDDAGAVRLSQNLDETTIISLNSISCSMDGVHAGTSYYREFELSLTGDLQLTSIEMGLEYCVENSGGSGSDADGLVPFQICLYYGKPVMSIVHSGVNGPSGYDATFCATAAGDNSQDLTILTIPIEATVPAGTSSLVVEIFAPGSDTELSTDFCFNKDPGNCLKGDVNLDGTLDLLDVAPFVEKVSSVEYCCEADINEDSAVNLLDVGPFVGLLSGG